MELFSTLSRSIINVVTDIVLMEKHLLGLLVVTSWQLFLACLLFAPPVLSSSNYVQSCSKQFPLAFQYTKSSSSSCPWKLPIFPFPFCKYDGPLPEYVVWTGNYAFPFVPTLRCSKPNESSCRRTLLICLRWKKSFDSTSYNTAEIYASLRTSIIMRMDGFKTVKPSHSLEEAFSQ